MTWTRRTLLKNAAAVSATVALGAGFVQPGRARADVLRPPGALPEDDFLSTCIRCGRCSDACPNRAITGLTRANGRPFSVEPGFGEEGTPVLFPRQQACNLCASAREATHLLCTAACPSGALRLVERTPEAIQARVSMGTARVELDLCYSYNDRSCGVCARACPFERKALRIELHEQPVVDPAYCIGCGLCERACIRYPQAIVVVPNAERRP